MQLTVSATCCICSSSVVSVTPGTVFVGPHAISVAPPVASVAPRVASVAPHSVVTPHSVCSSPRCL